MKTGLIFISLFLLFNIIIGCKHTHNEYDYLKKVLSNLEKIESATYMETSQAWQPGSATPIYTTPRFIKEYNNPMDTTIGASYVSLNHEDTTLMEFCYDGNMRVLVYHDVKGLVLDYFTFRTLPFRPVSPPFFNYTKNIIRYMLETNDSIHVETKDFDDHYYYKLIINEEKQVEFFGKAHHIDNQYVGDPTSIYELWISKSNNLPYKIRREMEHNSSASTCSEIEINKLSILDFNAFSYFPSDYEIREYGHQGKNTAKATDLTEKSAPVWSLKDANEKTVSLAGIKSKVILINFTGIGCGPCQAAIPFLKELKNKFNTDDFELVAIETWIRKPHLLRNYIDKNKLNYMFLSGNDDVIKDYHSRAVPSYFVLDPQRTVRKVISGYGGESTNKEIIDAIHDLL